LTSRTRHAVSAAALESAERRGVENALVLGLEEVEIGVGGGVECEWEDGVAGGGRLRCEECGGVLRVVLKPEAVPAETVDAVVVRGTASDLGVIVDDVLE
jgi:hypothetical protein